MKSRPSLLKRLVNVVGSLTCFLDFYVGILFGEGKVLEAWLILAASVVISTVVFELWTWYLEYLTNKGE